ncbi:MAG: glycosyltransferase [Patescibacteria group bacterium]
MKILYAVFKYDYLNPKRGFSFEHYNFYDTLVKMDHGKHEVIYFPYDEILLEKGRGEMNQELERLIDEQRPDLTFFVLFTEEFDKETIKRISRSGKTQTLVWMTDDHWRFDNYSRYWANCFNWVATTDSKAPEKYKKIGYHNVIKSQWACNHFLYKPVDQLPITDYRYEVSFVGQPHGNRKAVIAKIEKSGFSVDCFGFGWPKGKVSQEEMIRIFAVSKINLNLGNSSVGIHSLKGLAHLFLKRSGKLILPQSLVEIMNNLKLTLKGVREQIKGRNFEVPGCGGFLLTGQADNLEEYYQDGKEIVVFKDTNDLIEKIRYYLKNDKEREVIASAGYQRTLRDHTYEKRFDEIFQKIGLK